jgi:beta-lactamase class A
MMQTLSLLLLPLITQAASAPTPLASRISAKLAGFQGHVSLFAKNLDTGQSFGILPDDPVRTASTIKLPIMIECFYQVQEGRLNWTDPITLAPIEKASGSGILTEFSDNTPFPIRDLMHLMIVLSDNTATNLILNRITSDAVNARMESLGLKQTRNMRKILRGDDAQPQGFSKEGLRPENKHWGIGRSTPREMVTLLEKLYRNELVSPEASVEMIAVLKRQQDHEGIARDIIGATIASKSGALDHLRSDAGIVYTKHGAVAMSITVDDIPEINWTSDNPGSLLISSLSEILLEELGRKQTP